VERGIILPLRLGKTFLPVLLAILLGGCSNSAEPFWYSGTIEADEYRIVSQVTGQLVQVLAEEGDVVNPDQLVAKVDSREASLLLEQSEAFLDSLQAQLSDLKAGSRTEQLRQAEANLKGAEAQQREAEQNLSLHKENLASIQELYNASGATQQQLDQAQTLVDTAKSRLDGAKASHEGALAQLKLLQEGATSNAIKAFEASIRQAEGARDLARLRLERTSLKAIRGGTVISINAQPGELVNTGTALLTMADLSNLWVKIYLPEDQLNLATLGKKVKVRVDTYPDKEFTGEIIHIASRAEFTPRNVQTREERTNLVFAVKVKLLEGSGELKPGMPADVYL